MKVNKKRVFLLSVLVVTALFVAALCASCGLFGGDADVVPVTIDKIELLKTASDYTDSQEYLFNKDTDNSMALQSGEQFFLKISYNNPKKYAISYVTITPEGENAQKIMAKDFDSKSTKTATYIRFTPEESNISNDVRNYTIKKIYYVTGSETQAVKFENKESPTFSVVLNPTYTLTLDYQNRDRRRGSTKTENDKTTTSGVAFGVEMSSVGVLSKDYTNPNGTPEKAGGWKFEGWFTEENGQGICVGSTDKYFFWNNVTLYAYYTRLFTYEIVDLAEPIEHTYISGNGDVDTVTFSQGVVITGDNTAGKYPYLSIDDTIVDEEVKESGYVYAVEYPVVKIANNAFENVNNVTQMSLGKYVTDIGYAAFNNCNKLEKVTFNTGSVLKYIGDFAFQDTKSMGITSAFTLPDTVEYIGNFCFRYSGWSNTNNKGTNESVLHIYPRYKFLGVAAFFDTGFATVVFEPGCHYADQIDYDEAEALEKSKGWKEFHVEENRIGMNLFGNNKKLEEVQFLADGDNLALNIIPDRCFDAGQYKNMALISRLILSEGLEYIGQEAFNYQEKIPYLDIPASVKEIGKSAFYNCISVATLTFSEDSVLEVLHRRCFGNLASIDRVQIWSTNFSRYGDGPFEGCGRLKSIEFKNINDVAYVPRGFTILENPDEVTKVSSGTGRYYADLLFGTFETGNNVIVNEDGTVEQLASSYALPTRVFCNSSVLDEFRDVLVRAKSTGYSNGKQISFQENYNNVVFIHDINLIQSWDNPTAAPGEDVTVDVALQEVRDVSTDNIIGYSVVYWASRSTVITLPSTLPGLRGNIIEIAMYALPTSVTEVVIPETVTRLEHDAFNGCTRLERVMFENRDTLEYIGDFAFFGTRISEFEGGTGLKVIGECAFMNCKSLKWVDLQNTAITNPIKTASSNPRIIKIQQYKYEYEKTKDGKDRTDHYDTLYDGAFRGCSSLRWVSLPVGLKQVSEGLFTGCKNLRDVIIRCTGISEATRPTDDDAFYYYAAPTSIYDSDAIPYMTIYVPSSELTKHQTIFAERYGVTYKLIDQAPARE